MQPGEAEPEDDDDLGDDGGSTRAELIDRETRDDAQQSVREHRQRDHQPLLRRIEMKQLADLHGQGTKQHPDHEAHVEIQKSREQAREMSRLQKRFIT
jgi:hypothetical protein